MGNCIAAHTNPGSEYPGFINFTRNDNGTVTVTVRGNPERREGEYICGFAADKGKPGRCTPGDDRCNNYCAMAPFKGPVQKGPLPCVQVVEAPTVELTMSADEFAALFAEAQKGEAHPFPG